ncbi:hypothetical protein NPIL_620471 [Nephila pilipes]|uniref:Uncharacterized protein n=1 Tax=Nephila pilipes TaxID=299642 RepID=A0A8X6SZU6_NEPPI|nr:hypothetical protein NPIL_620471 [Nephila pilipes]
MVGIVFSTRVLGGVTRVDRSHRSQSPNSRPGVWTPGGPPRGRQDFTEQWFVPQTTHYEKLFLHSTSSKAASRPSGHGVPTLSLTPLDDTGRPHLVEIRDYLLLDRSTLLTAPPRLRRQLNHIKIVGLSFHRMASGLKYSRIHNENFTHGSNVPNNTRHTIWVQLDTIQACVVIQHVVHTGTLRAMCLHRVVSHVRFEVIPQAFTQLLESSSLYYQ